MLIYTLIFILIVFLAVFQMIHNRPLPAQNKIFLILCIGLFIMITYRGMGYDYAQYRKLFKLAGTRLAPSGMDFGFEQLCHVLPSFRSMFALIAAATMIPFYWVVKNKSEYCFMSLLVFYTTFLFPTVMGQMRQGMTIFIILYAYYRWGDKDKKWIFIIFVIACQFFHSSSIIALLFLLPAKKLFSLKVYILLIIGAMVLSSLISSVFAPYLNTIAMLDDTIISTKLNYYTKHETLLGIRTGFNAAVTIRCIVFFSAYYIFKRSKEIKPTVLNIYFLSIFIYLLFSFLPQLGGRGTQYFAALDIILIPFIIKSYSGNMRKLLIVVFLGIALLRFNQFFTDDFNRDHYVPYKFEVK